VKILLVRRRTRANHLHDFTRWVLIVPTTLETSIGGVGAAMFDGALGRLPGDALVSQKSLGMDPRLLVSAKTATNYLVVIVKIAAGTWVLRS